VADTDLQQEQAPIGNYGNSQSAPIGNGSNADTPQQQPRQDSAANRAFAAMRKENQTLKEQFERFQEESKPLQLLAQALKQTAGDGAGQQTSPDDNPYDPVTSLPEYNRWNRERESKVTQSATQKAAETAKQTASSTYQRERRVEMTAEAEDSFLSNHPEFSDGKGNWRDDLKGSVVREAVAMMRNGTGSGKYGAVTQDDIEGLLWKNPNTRSQMQTAQARAAELRTINGMKEAEQTRRPRGTINLNDITTPEQAKQAVHNLGLNSAEAARLIDSLPDELLMKL